MSKRLRILIGAIILALMLANYAAGVVSSLSPLKGSYDGWTGRGVIKDGKLETMIISVDQQGPAKALRQGDKIIAINGLKIDDDPNLLNYNRTVPPDTAYKMTIRRNGELKDIELRTVAYKQSRRTAPIFWIMGLFLITGAVVFLLRPDDKQAWLLSMMLSTMTGLIGDPVGNLPTWAITLNGAARAASSLFFPFFVHFFLVFPGNSPLLRRWPRLEYYLYLPYLFMIFPLFGMNRYSAAAAIWVTRFWLFRQAWFNSVMLGSLLLFLLSGLICLGINYRAASRDERRKLRVVMAGAGVGFFNLFLMPAGEILGIQRHWPALWGWFDMALFVTLPLIPISFAYAIIRHQVIPVSLIIRRSVRYLLVSHGSILLEVIAVTLAVTGVLTYVFTRVRASGLTVGIVSAAVGILAWKLSNRLHEKYLAPIIDKKFFRQSYDAQQIIADLADSLRSTTDLPQLLERVATRVQAALQTESVSILLRDDKTGDYLSGYSCEYDAKNGKAVACQENFQLPHYAEVIEQLNHSRGPVVVEPKSNGSNGRGKVETDVLRQMKSALLLPLAGKDAMPGVLSLGPRLGDVPYSGADKRLLMSVAGPTTFAIENSQLVEKMIAAAERRQELEAENDQRAKELEEARQLQLSMLPKTIPQLPHLEVAAYMKPANEVGGDYYDFHVSDGTLTIAVGDATGHGLKAGTVVTAMKSLFHCYAADHDVIRMLSQSSRVLKQMNLRSLYMGLTIVKLDGYRLNISAAGMPAVLIYRAATNTVEEIFIKAMPLGSVAGYPYRERELEISPGDVVMMMSDGFPERFNPANEMLDYDRAREVLAESASRSATSIIDHFVKVGDDWAQGRSQDDDVTFVVFKVK